MFVFAYAIAFLSAFGFDFVLEKRAHAKKRIMAILSLFIMAFCIVLTLQLTRPASVAPYVALNSRAFFIICMSGLCIMLFMRDKLNRSTLCVVLILLCPVDLILAHLSVNPVVPAAFYTDKPKLVHCMGETQHSERIFVQGCSWKDSQGRQLSPFALQHLWRQHLWPNTGTVYDISYVNGIGGTETQYQWLITELLERLNLCKRIRFLELSNTSHLITKEFEQIETEVSAGRLKRIQENLYQLPQALPRAYIVPDVMTVPEQAKAIEEVLKDDFNPRQCVVLEEGSYMPARGRGGGKVLDIFYEGPSKINIEAQSLGGYLVLLDSFYPGWKVLVNGQAREVLRANGLFKAVFLDPGIHKIVFAYRPQSFVWGLRISLISLCLAIIGLWVSRPKRRGPMFDP
jgi:hypothetical protein